MVVGKIFEINLFFIFCLGLYFIRRTKMVNTKNYMVEKRFFRLLIFLLRFER